MKKFIYGQIMGAVQLIFWSLMIPWIILTIPVDLFYTFSNSIPPNWIAVILDQSWIDWTYGLMMISTLNMTLIVLGMIWLGWTMMHPLTDDQFKISNIDRLKLVKSFSKKSFLKSLHEEAKEFQKKKFK